MPDLTRVCPGCKIREPMPDTCPRCGEQTVLATSERLHDRLAGIGLDRLAARARAGEFDDYFCPAEKMTGHELVTLVAELKAASIDPGLTGAQRIQIVNVVDEVIAGQWDGTSLESGAWMASSDGQETFRALVEGR